MTVVLDASALLASIKGEAGGGVVLAHVDEAVIGAVNFAEVVSRLADLGLPPQTIEAELVGLPVPVIAPDRDTALAAGLLRTATRGAGLSLGDRFCIALALRLAAPVLTSDKAWQHVAEPLGLDVRLIR